MPQAAAAASPEIAEELAIVAALAGEMKVVTVVLPAASSDKKRSQDQAALARSLHQGVPMLEFVMRPAIPPIPNGVGGEWYFDSPAPRKSDTKSRKDLRRDFMFGVAATMRDIERCKPMLVVGIEQGAVMVVGLTRRRVVETALATRVVQDREGPTWLGFGRESRRQRCQDQLFMQCLRGNSCL